jgi:hypothetical protein
VSRTSPQDAGPPELPGYRFVRHIGAGGNAQVYLYEQELPSRKVAVKVLNESALSAAARRRFTAEANVTAGLAHRHIVQVFDAKVTDDGRPYIVMPFYPHPNLSVRSRRAHFSVAEVLRIGIQIGSAVETSHRHGVLHRDIKPQNILTDSYGQPALTDFGIATTRPGDGPEGLSVPWSPPEILYGTGPGDQRSDVYSLGATLWHLLVGRSPFEQPDGGNTTGQLMDRISSDPPPRTERADVPNSLERLLRQTMAKDPAARPQSAMELIRGLQSIEQELRLPLTHPMLPADEPPRGDTRGSDTVARPAANAGEFLFNRDRDRGTALTEQPPLDLEQPTGPAEVTGSAEGTAGPTEGTAGPTEGTAGPTAAGTTSEPAAGNVDARTHADETARRPAVGHSRDQQVQPAAGASAGPAWDESAWIGETQDATIVRGGRRPKAGTTAASTAGPTTPSTAGTTAPSTAGTTTPSTAGTTAGSTTRSAAGSTAGTTAGPSTAASTPGAAAPSTKGTAQVGVDAATTRVRVPVILDPSPGVRGADPSAADPSAADLDVAGAQEKPKRGRVLVFAGGGALLVAVAAVAVLALPRGSGSQPTALTGTGQPTQSGGQSALGPGVAAPGQPAVTASRANARQVEFRWTYANSASGDTFRLQVSGGTGKPVGLVTKPDLLLTVATGHSACITVTVRTADGEASEPSNPFCWMN